MPCRQVTDLSNRRKNTISIGNGSLRIRAAFRRLRSVFFRRFQIPDKACFAKGIIIRDKQHT